MKRRRDKDYRGTKTSVDWSKLVHQVRLRKPGALEVLQDAILTYFPQQFEEAKNLAWKKASLLNYGRQYGKRRVVYVGFDGRKARRRFLPVGIHATGADSSPFVVSIAGREYFDIRASQPRMYTAYVYQTTGRTPERLEQVGRREIRGMRPGFTGSYKRPKVPIIYWYRSGPEEADEGDNEQTILIVRGPGAGRWAREKFDIANTRWEISQTGNSAWVWLDGHDDWIKDARREGYRNKTRFLQYPPDRSFLL